MPAGDSKLRVLILEDNPADAKLLLHGLRRGGFAPEGCQVEREADFLRALEEPYDLILADYALPGFDALQALAALQERQLDTPLIVVTGSVGEEVAVACIKQGAADYLLKDRLERLAPAARAALEGKRLRDEKAAAERKIHRLNEDLRVRLDRLMALREIDEAITGSVDLHLTLGVVLEQVRGRLAVDAAAVLLYEAPSQTLAFGAGRGLPGRTLQRAHLRLGEGQAGRAALERRPLRLSGRQELELAFGHTTHLSGAGFCEYWAVPLLAKGALQGVLELFHRSPRQPDDDWQDFLDALAVQTAIAIQNANLFADLQSSNTELTLAYDSTIEGWARALDLKDEETAGHSQRVTKLTVRLARHLGMSEAELVHVQRGALLHDIGKMGVPDSILLKPGKLSDEEWTVMQRHTTYAQELLAPIRFLRPALDIPYAHHERWDGSGYPRGLQGEEIPLAARIFAVVDVYDALTSDRPYRKAWTEAHTLTHIWEQAGTHFDPAVVEAFFELLDQNAPLEE